MDMFYLGPPRKYHHPRWGEHRLYQGRELAYAFTPLRRCSVFGLPDARVGEVVNMTITVSFEEIGKVKERLDVKNTFDAYPHSMSSGHFHSCLRGALGVSLRSLVGLPDQPTMSSDARCWLVCLTNQPCHQRHALSDQEGGRWRRGEVQVLQHGWSEHHLRLLHHPGRLKPYHSTTSTAVAASTPTSSS